MKEEQNKAEQYLKEKYPKESRRFMTKGGGLSLMETTYDERSYSSKEVIELLQDYAKQYVEDAFNAGANHGLGHAEMGLHNDKPDFNEWYNQKFKGE